MTEGHVVDENGRIVLSFDIYAEAKKEFENTTEFDGDLIFAEIINRRK